MNASQPVGDITVCGGGSIMVADAGGEDEVVGELAEEMEGAWGWFVAFGVLAIVLGMLAISLPLMAGLGIAMLLGWLLVFGGVARFVNAFSTRQEQGFGLRLILAVLRLVAGIVILARPAGGLAFLTIVLGVFFLTAGIAKISLSLQVKPLPNWGWMMFSGVTSLILALMILLRLPSSAAWVIGLLVGIEMLFAGWSSVMLGMAVRAAGRQTA